MTPIGRILAAWDHLRDRWRRFSARVHANGAVDAVVMPTITASVDVLVAGGSEMGLDRAVAMLATDAGLEAAVVRLEMVQREAPLVVVLLPCGPGSASWEAQQGLGTLAASHGPAVGIIVVWYVRAEQRSDALVQREYTGAGLTRRVNLSGLARSNAWSRTLAASGSLPAALESVSRQLTALFAANPAALAGDGDVLLSWAREASENRLQLVLLAECFDRAGDWHGHEMVSAAIHQHYVGSGAC